ncbi:MAG TPA: TPM domain-containing protein [Candidatus Methylomirabilis sp.]|nr:TPM domain-containing protein [Candidatus Methylomirabilis sp.]
MARHPRWVRRFMSDAELDAVTGAIREAEASTAAEIRVHLDHRCPGDPMLRAKAVFERLGMHRTAGRHGVLIYVAVANRKLAVIGDQGIHERVGEAYWERLVAGVLAHFREERPRDGFLHAVGEVGAVLRQHFPRDADDRNELRDDVTFC